MKRIDILKGVEQILVQKAYETGHISHRADGDWQKQADGSWIPYKGQSSQSAPQAQEPATNNEYGEITEEDLKDSNAPTLIKNKLSKEEKANINNKLYDVLDFYSLDSKELFGMKHTDNGEVDGSPNISYDWETNKILSADKNKFDKIVRHYMDKADIEDTPLNYKQAYNTIKGMAINNGMLKVTNHPLDTDENLTETPEFDSEEDSNDWEEEDTEGYYGNSGGLRSTIYEGAYDTQISNIGNTEEDDYGNSVPNNEAVENVVRGIMQEWTGDTDDEDAIEAVHDSLKDAVLDRWSSIYVQKSAVRDMRSAPTTKNMGF